MISELEYAERLSAGNSVLTLQFCVNYGGRAEIAAAAAAIAADVAAGKLRPEKVNEKVFARYLDEPDIPEVDLFVRSSGEQRLSNFLLWQSAYAELVFLNTLWPDFDRRDLWHACEIYASRDRRYGGAQPNSASPPDTVSRRPSKPLSGTEVSITSSPAPISTCSPAPISIYRPPASPPHDLAFGSPTIQPAREASLAPLILPDTLTAYLRQADRFSREDPGLWEKRGANSAPDPPASP